MIIEELKKAIERLDGILECAREQYCDGVAEVLLTDNDIEAIKMGAMVLYIVDAKSMNSVKLVPAKPYSCDEIGMALRKSLFKAEV